MLMVLTLSLHMTRVSPEEGASVRGASERYVGRMSDGDCRWCCWVVGLVVGRRVSEVQDRSAGVNEE